jgi:hypothetical protein
LISTAQLQESTNFDESDVENCKLIDCSVEELRKEAKQVTEYFDSDDDFETDNLNKKISRLKKKSIVTCK